MKIQVIRIYRLFNRNYEIKIINNRLILIAENGSGKTTLLRIIYFLLSKQWSKLCEYQFDRIDIVLNGKDYVFNRMEFTSRQTSTDVYEDLAKEYSTFSNFILKNFSSFNHDELRNNAYRIDEIEQQFDVPKNLIFTLLKSIQKSSFDTAIFDWDIDVIYLPTYRRIERDYFSLYGDMNTRISNYIKNLYPPIVEQIKKDVYNHGDSELERDLEQIFSNIINYRNQEKWMKSTSENLEMIEFGMSDIRFKILEYVNSRTSKNDTKLDNFLSLINKYFNGRKYLGFDYEEGRIFYHHGNDNLNFDLETLSSGEKQLISIFAHLYFDDVSPFIIIDEPEISLSLSWQEMLLDDIDASDCLGMLVATHSPFTINDKLNTYVSSINEIVQDEL